jgi:ABC-type multidrug transport system ATPase subunit
LLSITDLSKTYPGGVQALKGVSLEVGRGLFGLLGPNGAGKSTLMRTLATLQEPDAGRITLDGADVLADPQRHRRRLGYLPQDFGVYPGLSAAALLDHIAVLKGVTDRHARDAQVEALLRRTNLHALRRRAVDSFSGGMRRRFGIAQALLGDPRLVIVDVEDVRQLCPRMAVLSEGRVLLEGEPDRLVARLEGRVWRKTVDRDAAERYRATLPVLSTRLHSGRTRVQVLADAAPEPGFEPAPPDLEDVYFSALRGRPAA